MKKIFKKLFFLVAVLVLAGLFTNVSNAENATLSFSDYTLSRLSSIEEGPIYLPFDDFDGTTWVYGINVNDNENPETLSVAWVSGKDSLKNLYCTERRPDGSWMLKYKEYGGTGTAKFRLTAGMDGQTVNKVFSATVTEAPVKSKPVQQKDTVNVTVGEEVILKNQNILKNITGCEIIYMGENSTGGTSSVHYEEDKEGYRYTLENDSTFIAAEAGKYTIHIMVKPSYNLSKSFLVTVVAKDAVKPEKVSLDHSGMVGLKVGDKLQLKASFTPSDAVARLTWKSSKEAVATVSKKGLVTAVGAGTTTITVLTDNGKTAKVRIQVTAKKISPKKITLKEGTKLTMKAGEKRTLTPVMSPASAKAKLTWTSSDETVVTVSPKGVIKALKKGTATVTVKTDNGKAAKISITVKAVKPTKITLEEGKKLTMKVGEKVTLTPKLTPSYATARLTWTSSNEKVVTVSKKGVIKALKKGTATITVETDNGKTAVITITVKAK